MDVFPSAGEGELWIFNYQFNGLDNDDFLFYVDYDSFDSSNEFLFYDCKSLNIIQLLNRNYPDYYSRESTLSLSIRILNSQYVEGARDVRVL